MSDKCTWQVFYVLCGKNENTKRLKPWLKAIIRLPVCCQFQYQCIMQPLERSYQLVTVLYSSDILLTINMVQTLIANWVQMGTLRTRFIYTIQSDSFGTRPKKMRISQRLFIRFWTCIYDYILCFMRSMSILVCRSLTSWRHRDNDWRLAPCRAQTCHCVVR